VSEHSAKGHTVAGFIMVLIIAGLMTWLFAVMNSGDTLGPVLAGLLLVFVGGYAILGMGRNRA
jgi:hypothetical protein